MSRDRNQAEVTQEPDGTRVMKVTASFPKVTIWVRMTRAEATKLARDLAEDQPTGTLTGRACPYCGKPLPDSDDAVDEHYDTEHEKVK